MKNIKNTRDMLAFVIAHVIKQGEPSVNDFAICVYRGEEGRTCAVGCLIDDTHFNERFEGKSIEVDIGGYSQQSSKDIVIAIQKAVTLSTGLNMTDKRISYLRRLQEAHDSTYDNYVEGFKNRVKGYIRDGYLPQYTLEFIK